MRERKRYGICAVRGNWSVFGAGEDWLKHNGKPIIYKSTAWAERKVAELNMNLGPFSDVRYYVKKLEHDPCQPATTPRDRGQGVALRLPTKVTVSMERGVMEGEKHRLEIRWLTYENSAKRHAFPVDEKRFGDWAICGRGGETTNKSEGDQPLCGKCLFVLDKYSPQELTEKREDEARAKRQQGDLLRRKTKSTG